MREVTQWTPNSPERPTRVINWTPLSPLHIYDWFSDELKETAENLNTRIEQALKDRRNTDRMLNEIESSDVGDVDFTNLVFTSTHAEGVTMTLQSELALRRDLANFYEQRGPELRKEEEAARKAHREAGEKVRKDLVGIGYVDAPATANVVGKIIPDFVLRHPAVVAAQQRCHSIRDTAAFQQVAQSNQAGIEHVTRQLERFRSRAMGALGPAN